MNGTRNQGTGRGTAWIALAAGIATGIALLTGCAGDDSGTGSDAGAGKPRAPVAGGAARPEENLALRDDALARRPSTAYLSTFALDVDTASYDFTRRSLLAGTRPDPAGVRPEEFVNSFAQEYPEPAGNGFSVTADGGRVAGGEDDVRLLRVGLRTRGAPEGARRDANLTFVIDVSGSMAAPGRLDLVKSSLHTLVDQLRPSDSVAIVAYDSNARTVRPMTPASERGELHQAIDSLSTGSSTNLEAGMVAGYEEARRGYRSGATNRVILTSDGLANTGATTSGPILRQVGEEAGSGIALLCVGVGGQYGDRLMEELADHGNGRAVYVSDPEKARRLFAEQLPATLDLRARDAKAQIAFDSGQVDSFRLIGYDDRGLNPSDFRDDAVDGGEIGPGHEVTALYAVRLRPGAEGPVGDVAVRWKDPQTLQPQEQRHSVTVEQLDPDLWDQGAPRLRLAVAAGYFAEHLREGGPGYPVRSPYVTPSHGPLITHGRLPGEPAADLAALLGVVRGLGEATEDRDVGELATLIERAQRL